MRILIFTLEFPPMLGGAGTYAHELAEGFHELGHSVVVLTSTRATITGQNENYNYPVIRRPWSRYFWFLEWPLFLRNYLKREFFDFVVFANQGAIIIGSKLAKIDAAYVCTLHGSERYTFLAKKYDLKTSLLVKRRRIVNFLHGAKKVICVSQDLLNDVEKLVDEDVELVRIPLGIANRFQKPLKLMVKDSVNLVCTARFVKGKGQDKILYAMKELLPLMSTTKLNLTFIGNGVNEGHIRQISSDLGLEKLVVFKGLQSREKIAIIYEDMDIFIMLSSFKETFGLVYLEAMFAGMPVIGTNLGAVSDLIKDDVNGYLIDLDKQSPTNIAEVIVKAIRNRERLGRGSLKLSSAYTNTAMAESHLNIL
ncbi:glycosyltransferase involved in cell wall biosynthesis [Sphingobacterium allocomposti]|uniref:Glycosyltransferase involved in cell wall biosynthesis n=1 Tax=Sphingobacterium allocomposti TaxID=415956 RepID=A0A5S5DGV5_9SPHI|nr:glycosyltransferase family 4 protein [Sphingobacterium composti Yoo et al. 2007 non Ten et al. 2007]TYP94608.1 glycosyltransferase involved in cell wall biosynthesis [Sphingobacterium composti Yoo et al. 2007 non Ten et al. 2007]